MQKQKILNIEEANTDRIFLPPETKGVRLVNRIGVDVDEESLASVLKRQSVSQAIEWLELSRSSRLVSARVTLSFPNVSHLVLENPGLVQMDEVAGLRFLDILEVANGRGAPRSLEILPRLKVRQLLVEISRLSDMNEIGLCHSLQHLSIGAWPRSDFTPLASVETNSVKIIGGCAESTDGLNCLRLESIEFTDCKFLQRVVNLSACSANFIGCDVLDHNSISSIFSLRGLVLTGVRSISSLEFVRGCPSLRSLTIGARRLDCDLAPIADSHSLRRVFVGGRVKASEIARVANSNKDLVISNGSVCYRGGTSVALEEFYLD